MNSERSLTHLLLSFNLPSNVFLSIRHAIFATNIDARALRHFTWFIRSLFPEVSVIRQSLAWMWKLDHDKIYVYFKWDSIVVEHVHTFQYETGSNLIRRKDEINSYYHLIQCERYISNLVFTPNVRIRMKMTDKHPLILKIDELLHQTGWCNQGRSPSEQWLTLWSLGENGISLRNSSGPVIILDIKCCMQTKVTEIIASVDDFPQFEESLRNFTFNYKSKVFV
jgi:hypothetical protein